MDVYDQIIDTLDRSGAEFDVMLHSPEGRTDVASEIRGHSLDVAAKSMVVRGSKSKKNSEYYLVVVPGDRVIDLKNLKHLIGARKIQFAPARDAEDLTQCPMGAVPPFSFNNELQVVIDFDLCKKSHIVFNAGRLDESISLRTEDYLAVVDATFGNISDARTIM